MDHLVQVKVGHPGQNLVSVESQDPLWERTKPGARRSNKLNTSKLKETIEYCLEQTLPVKDASNRSSRDVLHEDGNHVLMEWRPQEAYNVGVSESFKKLHFPLETSVLLLCSFRVRGVQAHLLHSYQLALAGQATVHLIKSQMGICSELLFFLSFTRAANSSFDDRQAYGF